MIVTSSGRQNNLLNSIPAQLQLPGDPDAPPLRLHHERGRHGGHWRGRGDHRQLQLQPQRREPRVVRPSEKRFCNLIVFHFRVCVSHILFFPFTSGHLFKVFFLFRILEKRMAVQWCLNPSRVPEKEEGTGSNTEERGGASDDWGRGFQFECEKENRGKITVKAVENSQGRIVILIQRINTKRWSNFEFRSSNKRV